MGKNLAVKLLPEPQEITASIRPDAEAPQEEKRRERRPPLLAARLVMKATNVVSSISVEEMCNRVYGGVVMGDDKLKFWVDKDLGKNCFLLFASRLSIQEDDVKNGYWEWTSGKEKCFSGEVDVPVAKLVTICWLEFAGTFKTMKLSPKTTYDVAFVVKMTEDSRGLDGVVTLTLTLPDGTAKERTEKMEEKGKWKEILVGTFMTNPKNVGEIGFNFTQYGDWMSGLLVKGVLIQPKD